MSWQSFVAIGDSFTEGLDDPYPGVTVAGAGAKAGPSSAFRGWADLVAQRLAAQQPGFQYANLAIRGRLFDAIVDDQVPVALRLRPDLFSFAAGGNDVLRRNFNGPALVSRIDEVVRMLRGSGADVLVFRFADVTRRLPGRRIVLPRAQALNEAAGRATEQYGARLVDLWADDEFVNPLLWSVDRLHLNGYGHRRVAAHALTALDIKPDPQWWVNPEAGPARSWAQRRAADAHWIGQHLVPWAKRRLTGQSSGDLVSAKRPDLGALD
jgi:lysophospholipase L1-like esterase